MKFTDDIETKIFNALALENSRYGKIMKDYFKETVQGGLDNINLGDIRKGESVLEELKGKIPRSKLSEMNVKEPPLDKYLDMPRLSMSAKKEEAFNSKWYIHPLRWNQEGGRRALSGDASLMKPKKVKENNTMGKILKEVEKSEDMWEKVSKVERRIQEVTQSKETRLRDNLVDFMFK